MYRKIISTAFFLLLLAASGCLFGDFPFRREIREAKHISNFTADNNYIYFGAGYQLYRLDPSAPSLEPFYAADRIRVEQPVIADGTAYFGGQSYVDEKGNAGESEGFFAVDLQSRKRLWEFPLGVGGYGTFGTYPVLADDRILVCARQHLHCLDRKSGKELWKLDNWLGKDSDGTNVPYVYRNYVYYKISEEYFTGSDALDGHWAKVDLKSGRREAVLPIAETPGKYHDQRGNAVGTAANGVIYGATRYDQKIYPASRFGALDVEAQKLIWEVDGSGIRTQPALSADFVFTVRENSVQALDRKTGKVVWSEPLGEIAEMTIDRSQQRQKWDYENHWSRRFAATKEIVIAQGSRGIVARRTDNGKFLWFFKTESENGDADPLIFRQMLIVTSVKDCAIFALDFKTGKELWRTKVPDCRYFYIMDD